MSSGLKGRLTLLARRPTPHKGAIRSIDERNECSAEGHAKYATNRISTSWLQAFLEAARYRALALRVLRLRAIALRFASGLP